MVPGGYCEFISLCLDPMRPADLYSWWALVLCYPPNMCLASDREVWQDTKSTQLRLRGARCWSSTCLCLSTWNVAAFEWQWKAWAAFQTLKPVIALAPIWLDQVNLFQRIQGFIPHSHSVAPNGEVLLHAWFISSKQCVLEKISINIFLKNPILFEEEVRMVRTLELFATWSSFWNTKRFPHVACL